VASTKESRGPTPAGGVKSLTIFLDDDGNRVDEDVATRAEIIEYDAGGEQIMRTLAQISKQQPAS
jgi:hypothetical protein